MTIKLGDADKYVSRTVYEFYDRRISNRVRVTLFSFRENKFLYTSRVQNYWTQTFTDHNKIIVAPLTSLRTKHIFRLLGIQDLLFPLKKGG